MLLSLHGVLSLKVKACVTQCKNRKKHVNHSSLKSLKVLSKNGDRKGRCLAIVKYFFYFLSAYCLPGAATFRADLPAHLAPST